jgi:hypothetical protein
MVATTYLLLFGITLRRRLALLIWFGLLGRSSGIFTSILHLNITILIHSSRALSLCSLGLLRFFLLNACLYKGLMILEHLLVPNKVMLFGSNLVSIPQGLGLLLLIASLNLCLESINIERLKVCIDLPSAANALNMRLDDSHDEDHSQLVGAKKHNGIPTVFCIFAALPEVLTICTVNAPSTDWALR